VYTIFDTTLVTISRSAPRAIAFRHTRQGPCRAPAFPNLGLGHRGAVLTLYLLGAIGGGAAILVSYLSARLAILVGALSACGYFRWRRVS